MRTASLLVLLLMTSLLWAQEPASAPPPPPVQEAQPAPPAPPPEAAPATPAAQPAPQLGHPLDPADVATLTGHSGSAANVPAYRYYYPPYIGVDPASLPLFGSGHFSGSNWGMPIFSPIGFGRGNLFLFHGNALVPPLFGGSVFVGFRPHHHGGGHHH